VVQQREGVWRFAGGARIALGAAVCRQRMPPDWLAGLAGEHASSQAKQSGKQISWGWLFWARCIWGTPHSSVHMHTYITLIIGADATHTKETSPRECAQQLEKPRGPLSFVLDEGGEVTEPTDDEREISIANHSCNRSITTATASPVTKHRT
jgi:hypothetical protein